MKRSVAVMIVVVGLPCLAQDRASVRRVEGGRPSQGRGAESARTEAAVGEAEATRTVDNVVRMKALFATAPVPAAATLLVDSDSETGMELQVVRAEGEDLALSFVRKQDATLKPILAAGVSSSSFGPDLKAVFTGHIPLDPGLVLEPLAGSIGDLSHDNVSVVIFSEHLVMIALWRTGSVVGMFYAADFDAELLVPRVEIAEFSEADETGLTSDSGSAPAAVPYHCNPGPCECCFLAKSCRSWDLLCLFPVWQCWCFYPCCAE